MFGFILVFVLLNTFFSHLKCTDDELVSKLREQFPEVQESLLKLSANNASDMLNNMVISTRDDKYIQIMYFFSK